MITILGWVMWVGLVILLAPIAWGLVIRVLGPAIIWLIEPDKPTKPSR